MTDLPDRAPAYLSMVARGPVYRFRIYADASPVHEKFWTFVKTIECTESEIRELLRGWDFELKGLVATLRYANEDPIQRLPGHTPTVQVRVFGPLNPALPPADLKSLVAPPRELNP